MDFKSPQAHVRPAGPLALLSVALVALVFQLPIYDRWWSAMDEGHMLLFADLVTKGQLLYRDMTILPLPGAFYMLAGVFEIFGPSILVSRWVVVLEFCAFATVVFALLRRIVAPGYACGAVGLLLLYRLWSFPHWQIISYSTTCLMLLSFALYTMTIFFASNQLRTLAWSGLLLGLAVFCKQDYGAVGLFSLLGALVVYARTQPSPGHRHGTGRLLGVFLLPAAGVGLAAGLLFLCQGILALVVQFTVFNHFIAISNYEYPAFPSPFPFFSQDSVIRSTSSLFSLVPGIIQNAHGLDFRQLDWFRETARYEMAIKSFIYAPWLMIPLGLARLVRRRADLHDPAVRVARLGEIALYALTSFVVIWASFYRPADYVHLAVLYWPILCLCVVWLHALGLSNRLLTVGLLVVAAVPAAWMVGYSAWLMHAVRERNDTPIAGARGGVFVEEIEARMLDELVVYAEENTSADETLAVMPYFAMVQFLADRTGPHGATYVLWPFEEYPDRDQRVIDAMEQRRTARGIWHFTQFPIFPPVAEYAPKLFAYLVENFEIDRIFTYAPAGYNLAGIRRQETPAPGVRLIQPRADDSVLLIESAHGGQKRIRGARREQYLQHTLWPFRPVLALKPSLDGGRTILRVPIASTPNAHLHTAVGVHPDAWFKYAWLVIHFTVEVEHRGGHTEVFSMRLEPNRELEDRGWFPVDIDLTPYAGQPIRLLFTTAATHELGADLLMGGFEEPRWVEVPALDDGAGNDDRHGAMQREKSPRQ